MNFSEAMEALQQGAKVTRKPWSGIYFVMDGEHVRSYQQKLGVWNYDEDVMISDGWIVDGVEGEHKFSDIITYLQQGKRVWLKGWNEAYIQYDRQAQYLVSSFMDNFPYTPDFESFTATDWVTL